MSKGEKNYLFTVPNFLTLTRILLVPVFVLMMVHHKTAGAFFVFLLASSTDLLDGFIARLWKQKSRFGEYLDPAADKLLMSTSFIVLAVPALNTPNVIPIWLTSIVISRDLVIITGTFILYKMRNQTKFSPSLIGKACAATEMAVLLFVLICNVIQTSPSYLQWFYFLTIFFIILSTIQYTIIGLRILISRQPE